jgi:ribosomal protein S27E
MIRFNDRGKYEHEFQHEFAVRCPKCGSRAHVFSDAQRWRAKSARVSCSSCGYSASWSAGQYKGAASGIAKHRCRNCGRWLERKYFATPHNYAARLRCPGCQAETMATISWLTSKSAAADPYFGYPLWFAGTVKGNPFWAYNAAHLAFIRNYVEATIRIREPNRNASLASRLPHFLLDRKNRAAVLREIARIE